MKKAKAKKKKKRGKAALITILAIVAVLAIAGAIGWSLLIKQNEELESIEIQAIDFTKIEDGVYEGYYAGGPYGWRENRVSVTVKGGKVTNIEVLYSKDGTSCEILDELYGRVIENQSLAVDTVSQATLTSKIYLKSVEDALLNTGD